MLQNLPSGLGFDYRDASLSRVGIYLGGSSEDSTYVEKNASGYQVSLKTKDAIRYKLNFYPDGNYRCHERMKKGRDWERFAFKEDYDA